MFFKLFKRVVTNIKEIQEMALFGIMSNKDIYLLFNGSPMFYVILPLLGFFTTLQAFLKGYELFNACNKNFDRWFDFIVAILCSLLASVSLYGTVAATFFEFNFALGPWFFLGSISVAFIHHLSMMGLNLYRVFESPLNSAQHKHYMQAVLKNLFNLSLLAAVVGTVSLIMISSIAPVLGVACALTVVSLTTINILWRIVPHNWKQSIKNIFGLGKPDEKQQEMEQNIGRMSEKTPDQYLKHHQSIFIKSDHSLLIKSKTFSEGLDYLQKVIEQKIKVFNNNPLPQSEKNEQKKTLLKYLFHSLKRDIFFSKKQLLEHYPLAFQSFLAEKGDIEQIVEAAELLKEKYLLDHIKLKNVPIIGYSM